MKWFTNIEQSKILSEILPLESADFHFSANLSPKGCLEKPIWGNPEFADYSAVPCWSLSALLALLPLPTLEETMITDTETKWQCTIYCDKAEYWSELYNEPIDALVEAILIVKENGNFATLHCRV